MSKSTISFISVAVLALIIYVTSSMYANLGKEEVVNTKTVGTSTAVVATSSKITIADVQKHNTQADCWTTVNGSVYDLTSAISSHPGGAKAIMRLCGIDGSSAFNEQHGGQKKPNNELANLKVGELSI